MKCHDCKEYREKLELDFLRREAAQAVKNATEREMLSKRNLSYFYLIEELKRLLEKGIHLS